jgi:2-(1,2-epoxy-1,2-dihydrophenyl)acetyl-CoA isomerase
MSGKAILLEKEDGVTTITLNRPDALNAIDMQLREELIAALKEVSEDEDVRAVLITGAGRAFCAGGDVKLQSKRMERGEKPVETKDIIQSSRIGLNTAVTLISNLEKPVIAAINGVAAGAGCSLALACDIVFASDKARFSAAFVRVGLMPDTGGTYFLPRHVGLHKAKELVFTGDLIDADEAEKIGLVNKVVPADDLMKYAGDYARRLAKGATKAIGMAKIALNRAVTVNLASALEFESYAQSICFQLEDHVEGTKAFKEKREAVFKGR